MDDVFIMSSLFSHVEVKSDKVMTCSEILASEFYNIRPFPVFDKFSQFVSAYYLSSRLIPTSTVFDRLTVNKQSSKKPKLNSAICVD